MLDTQLSDTDFFRISICFTMVWYHNTKLRKMTCWPEVRKPCHPTRTSSDASAMPTATIPSAQYEWIFLREQAYGETVLERFYSQAVPYLDMCFEFDSRTPWPRASASQWFPWCSAPPCSLENSWRVNFSSLPLMLFLHAAQRCVLSKFSCSPILFLVARACVDLNKPLFISSWSFIR